MEIFPLVYVCGFVTTYHCSEKTFTLSNLSTWFKPNLLLPARNTFSNLWKVKLFAKPFTAVS